MSACLPVVGLLPLKKGDRRGGEATLDEKNEYGDMGVSVTPPPPQCPQTTAPELVVSPVLVGEPRELPVEQRICSASSKARWASHRSCAARRSKLALSALR